MTFAHKTVMELVKKSGATTLPNNFMQSIEAVFEANGGLWERIAKGESEQIGLLKQCVRSVLSGQVQPPPPLPVEPTASSRSAASMTAAMERADRLRHFLRPTVLIASHLDVDLYDTAMQVRTQLTAALSRTATVGETDRTNTVVALDDLIRRARDLGLNLIKDAQKVRAWQTSGGADQPFDNRVIARDSVQRRTFAIEARAYQSPWDALKVIAQSVNDLSVEPRRFLRGKVEMRIGPFFKEAVEILERLP